MFRRDAFGRFDPDQFITAPGTPTRRALLGGLAAAGLSLGSGTALARRLWADWPGAASAN